MTELATITLKDIKQFAQERLVEGLAKPELFNEKLKEVLEFAFSREDEMDDEAKAYADSVTKGLLELMGDSIGKLPDSAHKRKMARLLAQAKGKHHRADKLAEGLGSPAPKLPVAEAAKPIFLCVLQSLVDILFDVTRHPSQGSAQFATLAMLYWCVDELNVAFYLAERKYATQSYGHVRTVLDLLEKIELFRQQPQWADVWGGDDEKQILKELSPAAVRKKLGRDKFDPVYSFLSKLGSHGTFEAVRRRVLKRKKENDRVEVAIWMGVCLGTAKWGSRFQCACLRLIQYWLQQSKVFLIAYIKERYLRLRRPRQLKLPNFSRLTSRDGHRKKASTHRSY